MEKVSPSGMMIFSCYECENMEFGEYGYYCQVNGEDIDISGEIPVKCELETVGACKN